MAAISQKFETRKEKILNELSVPDEEYTDQSPKGSVDVRIRPLIRDINQLPGLVTTSSCAGRISVFMEGGSVPAAATTTNASGGEDSSFPGSSVFGLNRSGEEKSDEKGEEVVVGERKQFVPTGGKGSGRWQFVSHDPVVVEEHNNGNGFHGLFGLNPSDGNIISSMHGELRLVRFHFEPMILHIMAASLQHAKPVLAAASSSGFRESGIQGLRCLDDSDACPIVAVRSSGLSLESVIGYVEEGSSQDEVSVQSLVSEDYLRLLVQISNERFKTNSERMERFRTKLTELTGARSRGSSSRGNHWEDANKRRERKRAEGLQKSKAVKEASQLNDSQVVMGQDEDMPLGIHGLES